MIGGLVNCIFQLFVFEEKKKRKKKNIFVLKNHIE